MVLGTKFRRSWYMALSFLYNALADELRPCRTRANRAFVPQPIPAYEGPPGIWAWIWCGYSKKNRLETP